MDTAAILESLNGRLEGIIDALGGTATSLSRVTLTVAQNLRQIPGVAPFVSALSPLLRTVQTLTAGREPGGAGTLGSAGTGPITAQTVHITAAVVHLTGAVRPAAGLPPAPPPVPPPVPPLLTPLAVPAAAPAVRPAPTGRSLPDAIPDDLADRERAAGRTFSPLTRLLFERNKAKAPVAQPVPAPATQPLSPPPLLQPLSPPPLLQPLQPRSGGDAGVMPDFSSLVKGFAVAAAVATAVAAAMSQVVTASRSFVQAFSPSTVLVFDLAVRDLTATIGVGLVPVITTATAFLRELGSALLPIADDFARVAATLGGAVLQLLRPFLNLIGQAGGEIVRLQQAAAGLFEIVASALAPILEALATVLAVVVKALAPLGWLAEALSPLFAVLGAFAEAVMVVVKIFGAILDALAKVFAGVFRINLADLATELRSVLQRLIATFAQAVGLLAKTLGMTGLLDSLIDAFSPGERRSNVGVAAITDPRMGTVADYGKAVALQSAVALGGYGESQKDPTQELLKDIREGLLAIKTGAVDSLEQIIGRAIRANLPGAQTLSDIKNLPSNVGTAGFWNSLKAAVGMEINTDQPGIPGR